MRRRCCFPSYVNKPFSVFINFVIFSTPRETSVNRLFTLMMQLFQTILFGLTLGSFFSTALAVATEESTLISRSEPITSLPFNVSVEFYVPRNDSSGEFDAYALRITYLSLEGLSPGAEQGCNIAYLVPKSNLGHVYGFKNKKLRPVSSSGATLLYPKWTRLFRKAPSVRLIIFDTGLAELDASERLDFVVTRERDDEGKDFLRLRGDSDTGL